MSAPNPESYVLQKPLPSASSRINVIYASVIGLNVFFASSQWPLFFTEEAMFFFVIPYDHSLMSNGHSAGIPHAKLSPTRVEFSTVGRQQLYIGMWSSEKFSHSNQTTMPWLHASVNVCSNECRSSRCPAGTWKDVFFLQHAYLLYHCRLFTA